MSSASMQTVKAGWLHRQSDVFKRWKQQYCVLYLDGGFAYFSEETRRNSEGSLHLPTSLNFIKVGTEVLKVTAPNDRTIRCLLELQTSSGSLYFCADSDDDAEAWKAAMVEVKNMNVRGRANQSQQPPVAGVHPLPPPYAPMPNQPPASYPPQPQGSQPTQPKAGQPPAGYPPQPQAGQPTQPTGAQQPQVPPAYYPQPGSAPPPAYYPAPTQHVVSTTVVAPGRRRRGCGYPTQTNVYSYPGQVYYGGGPNTTTVYRTNGQTTTMYPGVPGQTTVVVQEGRNRNTDVATGFVAGAAVGSLMMAPVLFW